MPLVLFYIKTKIPRFYRQRGLSTHNNLMCRAKPSAPLKKIASWDNCSFTERDWSRVCCHGNNTLFLLWCTFLVPSLKKTAPISLEIFFIECCTVLVKPPMTSSLSSFTYYKTVYISKKKKKISPKEKHHSSLLWKAFQISNYYFLLHRHFKRFSALSQRNTMYHLLFLHFPRRTYQV